MASEQPNAITTLTPFYHRCTGSQHPESWSERYGERHRLVWIKDFPAGIAGPRKVRIYRRAGHFILQWWDKAAKSNLNERIDGDLVTAIARARQIDERLEHFRSSDMGVSKTQHAVLVEQFQADLHGRADAGEIDPRTVRRYESALNHYQGFVSQPEITHQFPHVSLVNREFALKLAAHLRSLQVSPNGHLNSSGRPMRRPDYVVDVTRAMFDWAADPQRGKLIPDGFRNPFLRRGRGSSTAVSVPVGEPDITIKMALAFLAACDLYQLRLFSPIIVYGLRAAEPCFLFHEHVNSGWLDVPCLPEVNYFTKGRRSKRLPLIPAISALLRAAPGPSSSGLLCLRRDVAASEFSGGLIGSPYSTLVKQFQSRCGNSSGRTAAERQLVRDRLFHEAGGLNYDHIATEFGKISRRLGWPRSATIKDFRHLAATCLENAGMPEHYRRFLLGQSPGRAAIVTYTHLNEIREKFDAAAGSVLRPLVEAIDRRVQGLSPNANTEWKE